MTLDYMIYCAGLAGWGIFAIWSGVWFFCLSPRNLPKWEKLPRQVWLGTVLALIDLFWVIPHSRPLLPESLHPWLIPAAIICAVLAYNFLDYLFSRALGGFFILLACYFLHESFTLHTPVAPLFACCCYAIGIVGIFFAGKPYLMRDMIRIGSEKIPLRMTAGSFMMFFGVLSLIISGIHFWRGV